MDNKKYFFYVLVCQDGSFYAGYTNDLKKRVHLHNKGKGAKYTRGRGPVTLQYYELFDTKSEALKAEYQFKQWSRKKKELFLVERMGGNNVESEKL
jgi:putative endonuclease